MLNFMRNSWLVLQGLSLFTLSYVITKWISAWKPTPNYDVIKEGKLQGGAKDFQEKKEEIFLKANENWSFERFRAEIERHDYWANMHNRYRWKWHRRLWYVRHRTIRDQFYDYYNWLYVAYKNKYTFLRSDKIFQPVKAAEMYGGYKPVAANLEDAEPLYIFWFHFFCAHGCTDIYLFICFTCFTVTIPWRVHEDLCYPEDNYFDDTLEWWGGLPTIKYEGIKPWHDRHTGWYWIVPVDFRAGYLQPLFRLRKEHCCDTYEDGESDTNDCSIKADLFFLLFPCFLGNNTCWWALDHYFGSYFTNWWLIIAFSFGYTFNLFGLFYGVDFRTGVFPWTPIIHWTTEDYEFKEEIIECCPSSVQTVLTIETGMYDPFDNWL